MSTRTITSDDAVAAAKLSRLIRGRPNDRIDPFPPSIEAEVLADSGARGKEEDRHPRVAVAGDKAIGYGAMDFSPHMKHALLVGPVVHPAHRRKGFGSQLLDDLLDQARSNKQKYARATVGEMNAAGQAMLAAAGFKQKEKHTCLRLDRPAKPPEMKMEGVFVRRVWEEDDEVVYELTRKVIPRTPKLARSMLKTDTYAVLLAFVSKKPVGFVEVDMRHGDVATIEQVDGPPSLIQKGLGNLLLSEAIGTAMEKAHIHHIEMLMAGTDSAQLRRYEEAGFQKLHELVTYERKL